MGIQWCGKVHRYNSAQIVQAQTLFNCIKVGSARMDVSKLCSRNGSNVKCKCYLISSLYISKYKAVNREGLMKTYVMNIHERNLHVLQGMCLLRHILVGFVATSCMVVNR